MQFWDELEGKVVEGKYRLGKIQRSEGRSAWFETELAAGQDGTKTAELAMIALIESLNDEQAIVRRLEAAKQVKHPNLMEIKGVGRTVMQDTPLVYAVMEHTDQGLADALRDRPLTKEEATDLACSMAGALTAIHAKGLVHTRVEPASILAAGETIKMRSDCLQAAARPGGGSELSIAADIHGLGVTLFQALRQRAPASYDDPEILRLPAPFAQIVRNSLSGRWALKEISTVLRLPVLPFAAPGGKHEVATERPAATATAEIRPAAIVDEKFPQPIPRNRRPLYVVLAAAVIIAVVVFLSRSRHGLQAPAVAPPVTATATPAPDDTTADKPAAAQPIPAPSADPASAAVNTATPASNLHYGRGPWRVVAFTYNKQNEAEHKARQINERYSDLKAEVFAPKGDRAPYLVALGGGAMSREEAFQLRDKARSSGLPHDTYAQNFPE